MYVVNFILKNCTSALSFNYKLAKTATDVYKRGTEELKIHKPFPHAITVSDDYGQDATVEMNAVAAVTFGDIERDLDRQGETALLQAKAQLRSQMNAKNDKGLAILSDAARPVSQARGFLNGTN